MHMNADIINMIINLSKSLTPVQQLVSAFSYLIALLLFIHAISVLKKIGDYRAQGNSQEKMMTPVMLLVGGTLFAFLPSTLNVIASTTFGAGSVLQYAKYNPLNFYNAMQMLIQTAGLIWFIRGTVLVVNAGKSGEKHGPKGLVFLIAGVAAINFQGTVSATNSLISFFIHLVDGVHDTIHQQFK